MKTGCCSHFPKSKLERQHASGYSNAVIFKNCILLMKPCIQFILYLFLATTVCAQQDEFTAIKINATSPVKNQFNSGTCWDFACASMLESELLKTSESIPELSETFTMYYTYIDKADKYLASRGRTMFAEGGIGEDMLNAIDLYGAMPEEIYPGTGHDTIMNRETMMFPLLKCYLDSIIVNMDTVPANWKNNFEKILVQYLGKPAKTFIYNGEVYTPKTFASEYIKMGSPDFIGLTSFTHHPYYSPFVIEVSHNYNNNVYDNMPLNEFISTVKHCVQNGYTLIWDTDITNEGFQKNKGIAMWATTEADSKAFPHFEEQSYTSEIRQQLFKNGVTQNNHLMLITGLVKNEVGKEFFVVKNSWGNVGPFKGYIYVSVPYFAINTISVLVNKKALPRDIAKKINRESNTQQTEAMNKVENRDHSSSMTAEKIPTGSTH